MAQTQIALPPRHGKGKLPQNQNDTYLLWPWRKRKVSIGVSTDFNTYLLRPCMIPNRLFIKGRGLEPIFSFLTLWGHIASKLIRRSLFFFFLLQNQVLYSFWGQKKNQWSSMIWWVTTIFASMPHTQLMPLSMHLSYHWPPCDPTPSFNKMNQTTSNYQLITNFKFGWIKQYTIYDILHWALSSQLADKVGMPNATTNLHRTPISEWYVVSCGFKN